MEIISSKSNEKIVNTKKLFDKKYRDNTGLFLVETIKTAKEAISAGLNPKTIFVTEKKYHEISKQFDKQKVVVTEDVLKHISSVVSPDGVVAVFETPKQEKKYVGGNFLILDCLQNPDNLGAILRTAAATNFKQIYLINSVDQFNSKTIRASMGNQFKLDTVCIDYSDIKTLFLNAKIYTMDMNGKNLFDIEKFDKNVGFVIGNEGNGISDQMKSIVTNTLKIPMENNVESLNASISASVAMYYVFSKK